MAVVVSAPGHDVDPLRPLIDWLTTNGYAFSGEHVMVAGVPVQFMPVWHPLIREAIEQAAEMAYDPTDSKSPVLRVMTPTYLLASWAVNRSAQTWRRRERAAQLREAGLVDEGLLKDLTARYGL